MNVSNRKLIIGTNVLFYMCIHFIIKKGGSHCASCIMSNVYLFVCFLLFFVVVFVVVFFFFFFFSFFFFFFSLI